MNANLILVIVRSGTGERLVRQLNEAGFRVTEFSSMGGFLRRRSATLLIGVAPDQVETALQVIRETCSKPAGSEEHNATIFVLRAGETLHF